MTPEETGNVVEKFLEAFKIGDLQAITDFYAPDYVNNTPFPGAPATYEGHAAFFKAAAPFLEFLSSETVDVVVGADSAAILSKGRYKVRESGEEFEAFGFAVVKFKDGKIVENWGGYDPVATFKMFEAGVKMETSA
ncbi:MAG: nuclear transport factor 2 family protein [Pseudomonadota bacterium]